MRLAGWLPILLAAVQAGGADPADKADEVFKAYTVPGSPGCAVGVMREGKVLLTKGYGMADLEQGVSISPKSVFYMGSVSKQFMAFSILLLEKQGKLSIDDLIRKHIPELPGYFAPVTLRQLLHHTAGVRDYLTLGTLAGYHADHVWTERGALRMIARQKALNFEPGAEYLYSNSGYVLLALAAQRVAGERLNDWAKQHVFGPLGMTSSRWQHNHADPIPNRAHGYGRSMTGAWQISNSMLDTIGGGGMYSSVEDMLKWAENFETRKLGGELLERMSQPGTLRNGQAISNGYGMGLVNGRYRELRMISHGGALAGYRTHFLNLPEKRLSVVCLCNVQNAVPQRLAERTADVWLEGDLGAARSAEGPKPPAAPKMSRVSPALQASIVGEWWSEELHAVYRFREDAGQLTVEVGDNMRASILALEDGTLRATMTPISFAVVRDQDGRIRKLTIEAGRVRGIELTRK